MSPLEGLSKRIPIRLNLISFPNHSNLFVVSTVWITAWQQYTSNPKKYNHPGKVNNFNLFLHYPTTIHNLYKYDGLLPPITPRGNVPPSPAYQCTLFRPIPSLLQLCIEYILFHNIEYQRKDRLLLPRDLIEVLEGEIDIKQGWLLEKSTFR